VVSVKHITEVDTDMRHCSYAHDLLSDRKSKFLCCSVKMMTVISLFISYITV